MKKMLLVLLLFSGCAAPRHLPVKTGYLVAVETSEPRSRVAVHKLRSAANVDSLVVRYFGYAIPVFNADSCFQYSPYIRIETLTKTVYAEQKEAVCRNGKMKLRKLRR